MSNLSTRYGNICINLLCLVDYSLFLRTLGVTVPHAIRSKLTAGGQTARHEKIKTILGDLFRNER